MLLRATLAYLPAQLLAALAPLVSMIVWTHWLPPAQLGAFVLVATTQELAYLVCLSWFSVYALRTLPAAGGDAGARERFLRTENAVLAAAGVVLAICALPLAAALPGPGMLWPTAPAIVAFFLTRAANAHYGERARAQSDPFAFALLQAVGPLGGLALGLAVLAGSAVPDPSRLWFAYAAAQAVATLLVLPRLGVRAGWRPDPAVLRAAVRFGGPMLGLSALGWIAESQLRYLVQWQSGAAALGAMTVGWNLGRRCASVASMAVSTAAFPIAARLLDQGRRAEAMAQLRLNAGLVLGVVLPVATGLALLGPPLLQRVVAAAYRDETEAVLGLAVFSGVVRCLHVHITDQCLVLEKRFRAAAWIDVVEIVACLGASAIGLAGWGLRGAAGGQLVGSAVALVASAVLARQRGGLRWPWADTFKAAAGSAALAVLLLALGDDPSLYGLAYRLLAGAAVYGLVMAAAHRPALARAIRARGGSVGSLRRAPTRATQARGVRPLGLAALLLAAGGLVGDPGPAASASRVDAPEPGVLNLDCADGAAHRLAVGSLLNNRWNAASAGAGPWRQCLRSRRRDGSVEVGWAWTWPRRDGLYAYPELLVGGSPWTTVPSNDPRFPRTVRDTRAMTVDYELETRSNGKQNTALEFWLSAASPNGAASAPIRAELMVWSDASPGMVEPGDRPQAVIEVDGRRWTLYVKPGWGDQSGGASQRWTLITYVATDPGGPVRYDARRFLDDALARGLIRPDDTIAGIELGNEIVSGSGSTWIRRFTLELR